MKDKYLAFDIEIAEKQLEDKEDWKIYRPLGIICAAAIAATDVSQNAQWSWFGHDEYVDGRFSAKMSKSEVQRIVRILESLTDLGYKILTWNGLGFDFDILAEESKMYDECKALALNHIDMMFHFFCSKGFPLGLDAAAKGMSLPGKLEGMDGAKAPEIWPDDPYKVLAYCSLDVKNTLALAEAVEKMGHLDWTARSGKANSWECSKWLTVKEAMALPEPDTSWMTDPWTRSKFYGWTGYKPEAANASPNSGEHCFDITGISQWDPDEGSYQIDGPDET